MLKFKDFPALVQWVADTYHDGVVDAIGPRAGISGALADKWVKGKVRAPRPDTLMRFCAAYKLPFAQVMKLAYPGLSRRRMALGTVALALLLTGADQCYAADFSTIYRVVASGSAHYVVFARRLHRWLCTVLHEATICRVRVSLLAHALSVV